MSEQIKDVDDADWEARMVTGALQALKNWEVVTWWDVHADDASVEAVWIGKKRHAPFISIMRPRMLEPDSKTLYEGYALEGKQYVTRVAYEGGIAGMRAFGNALLGYTGLQIGEGFSLSE